MSVVLSGIVMLLDLFVAIMQVTVSVTVMQLKVSVALMQMKVFEVYMWKTIFIEIMQVGVSVAIMQVLFFAVHYAHDYFYCNYAGVVAMYVTVSSSNFIFLPLTDTHFS